ncbi:glycosyltransferase family 2 protein [Janibacter sp. DB-40]|uniref:glycosyltransferase family 2 protein n=1 Tax=Janibacter sp. DB-40 TaxID=3028808 RepID=UPI0024054713|nr:glycosyltransferase family 2 protein [Janibacter sp. DB-40]
MICTVSTIKDSIANVTRFVEENLAAGADHLFIFSEGGDHDVLTYLEGHPHVTVVDADAVNRRVAQPENLNTRQTINANRINWLLADIDSAEWLFHLDGDEILDIDKERLLALGPDVATVRLVPKESVSSSDAGYRGYFKRLLSKEELALLTLFGVIDEAMNSVYFHGHVSGKVGLRPSRAHGVHIHDVSLLGEEGTTEDFRADWLHVLHYDSLSPEEYLRKWSVNAAGTPHNFRGRRKLIHAAMSGLVKNERIDENTKREYMLEIYRREIEDDAPSLEKFGLLERVEPRNYRPGSFSRRELDAMTAVLPRLLEAEPRYFQPRKTEYDPAELMATI